MTYRICIFDTVDVYTSFILTCIFKNIMSDIAANSTFRFVLMGNQHYEILWSLLWGGAQKDCTEESQWGLEFSTK